MAPSEDSNESVAHPDDPENLPGELLGEHLIEPDAYEVAADEAEAEELDPADVTGLTDDADVADPAQLAAAETVAQQARSSRPVRKNAAASTAGKSTPTPARRRGPQAVAERPSGPVQFARESVDELKKVVWPTWSQVQQYFWAVLVFVLIVIAYVGVLDLGFGWVMLKLFGEG